MGSPLAGSSLPVSETMVEGFLYTARSIVLPASFTRALTALTVSKPRASNTLANCMGVLLYHHPSPLPAPSYW